MILFTHLLISSYIMITLTFARKLMLLTMLDSDSRRFSARVEVKYKKII